jgi:hypothetical protein
MLVKPDLLVRITDQLAGKPLDWDKLVPKFKESEIYRKGKYSGGDLPSLFSELGLRQNLEEICAENSSVKFDAIKDGNAGEYYFITKDWRTHVLKAGESYGEIDQLAVIEGVPVLFEVKLISSRYTKGRRRKSSKSGNGINFHLRDENVSHAIAPVKKYFGTDDVGYVFIFYPALVSMGSTVQRRFAKQNGVILPFYADRLKYMLEVLRVKSKYKL